ncbi:hypothetical protein CHLRE_03g169300v5 [Chlamydomonas reinhardtii]|uniref:ABC transporter domain-containing protein n=1 Tax=Chlamydomonas reinhardtii TaxID=3055 RepID=A0A2K3DWY9_CHLRE|nr:uncharacterized protein CHLRE_03g169300v5 [Chlamydomonas reinhardtii]PNW85044.1 hypothetical protein CHLRE_03g169300v5 [Chlamydomonas reinhardtii]
MEGHESQDEPPTKPPVLEGPDITRLQILFQNLTYTVQVKPAKKGGDTSKSILKDVSGVFEPARLTAVMGASGSGKTTLLNVLAGFYKAQDKLTGDVLVNGKAVTKEKMRRISGFVHQEDVILHTMTVREALEFAAALKLPSSMTAAQKSQRAMEVAQLLNLHKSLDSVVGSSMIKGISGGEKRRLSLGMEMVTEPAVLFLDESSSGLDSFTAFKVVHILRSVAHLHGRTVVCSIHQPSSEVFHLFDDLVVLAAGQIIYLGQVQDMVGYFGALGYHCPNYTNPADYLFMEVLNAPAAAGDDTEAAPQADGANGHGHHLPRLPHLPSLPHRHGHAAAGHDAEAGKHAAEAEAEAEAAAKAALSAAEAAHAAEEQRIASLIAAWDGSPQAAALHRSLTSRRAAEAAGISKLAESAVAPFWLQAPLLARRALLNAWRNPLVFRGKLAQTVFLSLVVGLIYLQVSDDLAGVQDRQGSLFFLVVEGLFGSVMGILTVFGSEKPVFQREFGTRLYGLPAYFISRWLVELPSHIILPVLFSCICYFMIGYQATAAHFGWFALTMVLMDNSGAALGIFVSCLFNDLSVALSVMPMFLLPLMVFSGFFVNSDTIPPYFTWIQYISPMRYGYIALAKNEFAGLQINCSPDESCPPGYNGAMVLANMGFSDKGSVGQNLGILFAMVWALLLLAYVALWLAVRRLVK